MPRSSEMSPLWMKLSPFAKNGCWFSRISGRLELARRRCHRPPRAGSSAQSRKIGSWRAASVLLYSFVPVSGLRTSPAANGS